jgi:hypothetical protein
MRLRLLPTSIVITAMIASSAVAAPTCPINYGSHADAKRNKLYLYFPTTDDATFPNVDPPPDPLNPRPTPSSPLHRFDTADLPDYSGTVSELRNAISDVVADIYCEFNVQVIQTTTVPPSTEPRRNTVGIGTDANVVSTQPACQDHWWTGQAQTLGGDTGDVLPVDYARVWAGTYQTCAGGPTGGALHGGNSTLERWANSIGSTAGHEAAHNYGLSHADGDFPLAPGEDAFTHHLMRAGGAYNFGHRAERRHFSDHEYSVLASNVGLTMDTMWNWDFINPNAATGTKLRMEFLSDQQALILSWSFSGVASPWINPILSGPSGTRTFKGATYNVYNIEWSTGHPWSGGPSGQLPGGSKFHIGATFSSVNKTAPDAIIIADVKLFDADGDALPLHPRWVGFDAGAIDISTGLLNVRFFNFFDRPLIIRDVQIQDLSRILSIDAMMPNEPMRDLSGRVLQPWPDGTRRPLAERTIESGGEIKIEAARLSQKRHVFKQLTERDCAAPDPEGYCRAGGFMIDLFPATTMYITATVVDPHGQRWDPSRKRFVTGAIESRLFYQIAGRRPDLNRNGIDDLIDIQTGKSSDRRGIGVPDDAHSLSGDRP